MIDLSVFDLKGLQSLHVSFLHLLEDYTSALKNINDTDVLYTLTVDELNERIQYFNQQIKLIESKIIKLSAKELRFSVEYLFYYFGLVKKTVQFHFITTSDAYKKFGRCVTGIIIYTPEDFQNLLIKTKNNESSDGIIKVEDEVSEHLSDEIRLELKTKGFFASEVDSILY